MTGSIRTLGVIGAGQMGCGIAQVSAVAGYEVRLNDITLEAAEAGKAKVVDSMERAVGAGKMDRADADATAARIVPVGTLDELADCDLVIEAASEKEEIKREIFARLCPVLKPEAMLASNTSSISITRLAAATDRPERFMGIHFMNPVPRMKLVELVRGIATEDVTFEASKVYAQSLGKTTTVSEDFPAFIVNRILLPMINEAIYTLYEGVGSVEAIDTAMKLGANHPMGPLGTGRFHRPRYLPRHHAGAA